jgi:3-(methylthio)propanoyl-CoA dehydrogenase
MRAMFTMMNNARLSVGVEGLGVGVRAYQAAVAYARERVQSRVVGGEPGESIIGHPDVRRMLVHMRSHVEAMRLLAYTNAVAIDRDDQALADLLTPLTKSWCTDTGSEIARLATQVVGGMGYIRETGVEQHERDVRIAAIYEGTNGIQAIDLINRKLDLDDGGAVRRLVADITATAEELGDGSGRRLADAAAAVQHSTDWIRASRANDPRDALAGATPFLRLFATTVAGWLIGRQALAARAAGTDDVAMATRVTTARYFLDQVVPSAVGLVPAITAGAADIDAIPADAL